MANTDTRRSGAYVLISTQLYAHPAVTQATSAAQVLWIRCLSEMNATTRDGTLPKARVRELAHEIGTTMRVMHSLIAVGMAVEHPDAYEFPKQAGISKVELWRLGASGKRRPQVSPSVRARVYARDGHACRHCGSTERLSIDHIVPWSKGGAHHEGNFQTLCMPCNMAKGVKV